MKADVLVIGAGLFGRVIGHALEQAGRTVTWVDANLGGTGSKPAACLMKPSWFSSMGKDAYDPALELLDNLYGVQELTFKVGPAKLGGVLWVPPKDILQRGKVLLARVKELGAQSALLSSYDPVFNDARVEFTTCIIATGVWASQLCSVPGLEGQAGAAFTWHTRDCFAMEPFIRPWAPYKQIVAFQRDANELWVGDGSAIKPENWTGTREQASRKRCAEAVGLSNPHQTLYGVRPYTPKAKPAYLAEVRPGTWVATGGAKNGTLGAAWCAHRLLQELT